MTRQERRDVLQALEGLLEIARLAMPDTYYQSDSRVNRAQALIDKIKWVIS